MTSLDVLSVAGQVKSKIELPAALFEASGHDSVLWEAIRAYLANRRQGTAKTKRRSEVSGTGKKPYRQKHTGRSRHGSRRSPLFVGGGVVFGPQPRDFRLGLPRRKRRLALRLALVARNAEAKVLVIEDFELASHKTKGMVALLAALGLSGSVLLLVSDVSDNLRLASRNIELLRVRPASQATAYEVLACDSVVFTEGGLASLSAMETKA